MRWHRVHRHFLHDTAVSRLHVRACERFIVNHCEIAMMVIQQGNRAPPRFINVDHKTSHKGSFFKSRFIHHLKAFHWCMVCYDRTIFGWDATIWKSGIWGSKKNLNIEKITFKVVQMKFLAMHITNQKLRFDIFTVVNLQNIFMEHDL